MKRLYVGCRVRIVSPANPKFFGDTGRLIAFTRPSMGSLYLTNCRVDWDDGYPNKETHTDRLEPIQDPGHEVISWEEMRGLWTPEGVAA